MSQNRKPKVHPFRRWRLQLPRWRSTIEVVAKQAQCSPGHLSQIERGEKTPSLPLAQRLAQLTGGAVRVEDF